LLRTSRTSNSLQNLRSSRPTPRLSNYFSPSHTRFPSSKTINFPRYRSYNTFHQQDNVSGNKKVLYSLMGINAAVFAGAMYTKAQAQAGHPQAWMKFMRTMSCNLTDVLKSGAWYQVLTSTFTHVNIMHFAANMFTAYFLGEMLCYASVITPASYLTIAIGAGVTGSLGFLFQRYWASGGSGIDHVRGLGFSGALMGITTVAACLAPMSKVLIYGIVPVPLWGLAVGYGIYDGYYVNDKNSRIGHAGHLGGAVFGVAYYILKLRGLKY
jgi:membrane associated rhomboid family serine protease